MLSGPLPEAPKPVVVFRQNLFRVSEPYIAEQARRLARYRPVFVGRRRYGEAPPGTDTLTLRETAGASLAAQGWQMLSRDSRGFARLLDRGEPPSLVHAHFGTDGVHALPLAERLGVPLVTSFHGFDATLSTLGLLSSPAWANYPLFRRRLAARGALFLCASHFLRDRVLKQGFPPERTHVHHVGVDTIRIAARDPQEERPAILHVARLVPVKGTAVLLRAFARLPEPLRNRFELRLAGDGPLRSQLQRLAGELGIAGRTRFLGALPHEAVLAELRRAAVSVLPSIRTGGGRIEGFGLALLEAAATGVPTLGSAIGGIPEALCDGETGFLAPPGDADALATRLETLLRNPALRRTFGAAGRQMAERAFDLRARTASLEAFYDRAIATYRCGAAMPRGA